MLVTLNYYNRSNTETEILVMYVAVYDAAGRMKGVDFCEETITPDEIVTFEIMLTSDLQDGDFAKVFLWTHEYAPVRSEYLFE